MQINATNYDQPQGREGEKPKRRWYQYSLRTLLIFMTVAACSFGWLGMKVEEGRRQREAVEAVIKLGGDASYGDGTECLKTTGRGWIDSLLGGEVFNQVRYVSLESSSVTAADLSCLRDIPELVVLDISNNPQLTDLALDNIRDLTQLRMLRLEGTSVTDAGLVHLKGLNQLTLLRLGGSGVTKEGLKKLEQLLPNCDIR